MEANDLDLEKFEAEGARPLPVEGEHAYVENDGARIWYFTYGSGAPVILLHGGLGHSGNWGYQVPALAASGYRVVLIDSRGHGHSTRDARRYSYELMASDVLAVMDTLHLEKASLVGWSDGACNMDPSGVKPFEPGPLLNRCFRRHKKDYARLSPAPDQFHALVEAVTLMQRTQPDYSAQDVAAIDVPVTVVLGEHDEFITRGHIEYLAQTIPKAELVILDGVSHFAPLQRPEQFNHSILEFLERTRLSNNAESSD